MLACAGPTISFSTERRSGVCSPSSFRHLTAPRSRWWGSGSPVVGIGVNVAIREFPPELAPIATSLVLHREREIDIPELAEAILQRLDSLPEPDRWDPLYPIWDLFDDTPGKLYRLPTGEDAVAIGVGPQGELVCAVDGETTLALAADAILGRS